MCVYTLSSDTEKIAMCVCYPYISTLSSDTELTNNVRIDNNVCVIFT